jgi:alanine racemase
MDLTLIDVTDIPGVDLEDEVVLMGPQGDDRVSTYDLAGWANTIPYEIICGVGTRVPRRHIDSGS